MANKKLVIALSVIGGLAVVLLIAVFIAVNIANSRIENEVSSRLDSAISDSGIEEHFSYGEVKSQAAKGMLTLTEVKFLDVQGGSDIQAASVSLKIPPGEAAALAKDPENAVLSKAEVMAESLVLSNTKSGGKTEIGSLSFAAEGELSQALMQETNPKVFLEKVSSIRMNLKDSKFQPGEQFMMQMMMVPGAAALAQEAGMNVKSMDLDADLSPEGMKVKQMDIDSGLMSFKGNMDLKLNEMMQPKDIAGEFSVEKLHDELHKNMAPFFEQMGQTLPDEGPFTLNFKIPENGIPEITIE
jgi:hypothetical protein